MMFSIIHGCEMYASLQSSRKSLPSRLLVQLTRLFSTGYDISRRNLYKPVVLDYVQIRCFLSRCTGATRVHQVSQQIGHGNVDMGGSWRVSIGSPSSSFFLLIFYTFIFYPLHPLQIKIIMVDVNAVKQ